MQPATELAVVLNPRAGSDRRGEALLERLRELSAGRGAVFSTGDPELTNAVAEGVRERGVATVAIVGGDGTVSSVLSALQRAYGTERLPRIALLRGGTMNTVANALGISPGTPDKLLSKLLARPTGPVLERATLSVEGRVGFLFSAGVMVGFLDALYGTGDRTRLRALQLLARGSVESLVGGKLLEQIETPVTAALTIERERHPTRRYVALGAGTVPQIGLGFRPYARCEERSDAFQVFAFHGSMRTLLGELPRIRRGEPISAALGFAPLARRLSIEPDSQSLRYALDGDVYQGKAPLVVEVGPTVRVAVL